MKKNNQKCIRISDETLEYINSFTGDGFNQKLENMVAYVHKNEDRIKKHISDLEKRKEKLEKDITEYANIGEKLGVIAEFVSRAYQNTLYK